MNNHQRMVEIFMGAFEQDVPSSFRPHSFPAELRLKLIREEVDELESALEKKDWIEVIDALCDILYVTYGAASALGVDIEPFFAEIQRSNMSKLGLNGKPVKREDGKVIKGENYSPPDLAAVMRREKLRFYLDQVD